MGWTSERATGESAAEGEAFVDLIDANLLPDAHPEELEAEIDLRRGEREAAPRDPELRELLDLSA